MKRPSTGGGTFCLPAVLRFAGTGPLMYVCVFMFMCASADDAVFNDFRRDRCRRHDECSIFFLHVLTFPSIPVGHAWLTTTAFGVVRDRFPFCRWYNAQR